MLSNAALYCHCPSAEIKVFFSNLVEMVFDVCPDMTPTLYLTVAAGFSDGGHKI